MTGSTVRRYEQLETSPETIEQELRPAVCEHRRTDRLKENYSIDKEKLKANESEEDIRYFGRKMWRTGWGQAFGEQYQHSHSTVTHVTFSLKIKFESCINSIITTMDL